jgi:hypothetical protein
MGRMKERTKRGEESGSEERGVRSYEPIANL